MPDDNKYPKSSPGVAKLFKLDQNNTEPKIPDSTQEPNANHSSFAEPTAPPPVDLPVIESIAPEPAAEPADPAVVSAAKQTLFPIETLEAEEKSAAAESDLTPLDVGSEAAVVNPLWRWTKALLPWIAIFGIAVGLYFFYFSDFTFYSLF